MKNPFLGAIEEQTKFGPQSKKKEAPAPTTTRQRITHLPTLLRHYAQLLPTDHHSEFFSKEVAPHCPPEILTILHKAAQQRPVSVTMWGISSAVYIGHKEYARRLFIIARRLEEMVWPEESKEFKI